MTANAAVLTYVQHLADDRVLMIDEIDLLQQKKNNGRGVSCVKSIIIYYRRGMILDAEATCFNENDKIRNYPDIQEKLAQIFPKYRDFLIRWGELPPS